MTLDRDKFMKVCGLLGSDQDGQILAAAYQANKMLRAAGLVWQEVLEPHNGNPFGGDRLLRENRRLQDENARLRAELANKQPGSPADDKFDEVAAVKECLKHFDHVSQWEREFLESIDGALVRWGHLTDKQRVVLTKIVAKLRAMEVWGLDT